MAVIAAFATTGGAKVYAQAQSTGDLRIANPWMRLVLPTLPAAGYFVIENKGSRPRALVGAQSPSCGSLMLHLSVNEKGQDSMKMVERVSIPARGSVTFAPGGYHLMCMQPKKDLHRGTAALVTLRFADGETLSASFPVRNAAGK